MRPEIEALGLKVFVTDTVMSDDDKKTALSLAVLQMLAE
jgi:hypothetical protein